MWPEQYIEWAGKLKPLLTRVVANALAQHHFARNPSLNVDTPEIVREVVGHAFDLARRRAYRSYFASESEFLWWLQGIAFTQLVRVLVERDDYTSRLHGFPSRLLQSFGWVVLDGIESAQVASRFGVPVTDIDRWVSEARNALFEVPGTAGRGGG